MAALTISKTQRTQGIWGFLAVHPLLLLLPFATALLLLRFDPNVGYNFDDASYIIVTDALRHGMGRVLVNDPLLPLDAVRSVGFPLLLTPVAFIWEHPLAYKFAEAAIYLLSVAVIYGFFRRYASTAIALFVAIAYAANNYTIEFAYNLFTEVPYILFSFLALAALMRYRASEKAISGWLLLTGLTINAAIYIRSVGILLLVVGVGWLWWQCGWRKAVALTLTTLLLSAPMQLGWLLGSPTTWSSGYLSYFKLGDLPTVVANNAPRYLFTCIRLLLEWPFQNLFTASLEMKNSPLGNIVFALLLTLLLVVPIILIAAGVWYSCTPNGRLLALYMLAYLALIMIWPFGPEPRFVLPLLPILLYFIAQGVIGLRSIPRFGVKIKAPLLATVLLLLLTFSLLQHLSQVAVGSNLVQNAQEYLQVSHYGPQRTSYINAALWLRDNTPPDTLIVCNNPYDFYLWSNRHTIDYSIPPGLLPALERSNYVIITALPPGLKLALNEYFAAHRQQFQLIQTITGGDNPTYIYKFIKQLVVQTKRRALRSS